MSARFYFVRAIRRAACCEWNKNLTVGHFIKKDRSQIGRSFVLVLEV